MPFRTRWRGRRARLSGRGATRLSTGRLIFQIISLLAVLAAYLYVVYVLGHF